MADSFDDSPFGTHKTHASSLKRVILIVLVLLLSGVAIFAISQLTAQKPATKSFAPTPTQQPTPTEMPSPTASTSATPLPSGKVTPTPKGGTSTTGVDRSSITIAVQNGSGIAGAASKMAAYLQGLGYTVSSSGNADAFDYVDVTISVKAADSKFLSLLKTDLAKQYTVGSSSATLPATAKTNAVVIVGK